MNTLKTWLRAGAAVIALSLVATAAEAQVNCDATGGPPATCNLSNTATATAPSILRLTLSTNTTALSAVTLEAYDATVSASSPDGWHSSEGTGSITVQVRANQTWKLEIDSADPDWGTVPVGHTGKDVGDIAWSTNATNYTALSTTPTAVDAAAAAPLTRLLADNSEITVSYRTAWRYDTDIAGNYAVVVRYTLTAD